ncbi:hypothetical protein, partial [Ruminococcus flavefaciens]|uniref:hypothetical protein n=1 Tax=Ruminococcus flavefaciens TaxID=1265 RepID=UPI002A91A6D8
KDQQFQRRRSPTCGTKKFKATISSRCLIYAYFRFWVFYDCTFLDNSSQGAFGRYEAPSWYRTGTYP